MTNTSNHTSTPLRTPLASLKWLKYLGIVLVFISLYVLIQFYYHYADIIFPKSLTAGQYVSLSSYSILSQFSSLIVPLLFFSGALLYRSVRLKGINPLHALKRDLLVIAPLGLVLWLHGAFGEESVKSRFYAMIFEVQELKPGEKLVQDPTIRELMALPSLSGLHEKIDTLDIQIKEAEGRLVNQLATLVPPSQLDSILEKIDFGPSSIVPEDVRNSSSKWDGIERRNGLFANPPMVQFIESLIDRQNSYQDEIRVIHFTPFYILLFMIFGLLLGYLIPLHKAALAAVLLAIGYLWFYSMSVSEVAFEINDSNRSWFVLAKIGLLILVNSTLLFVANRVYKRSKSNP